MVSDQSLAEKLSIDRQAGEMYFEDNQQVYHCDYFNVYWQKSIERASAVDGKQIISEAVRDQMVKSLNQLFGDIEVVGNENRSEAAEDFFSIISSMGNPELPDHFEDGDTVIVHNSHFGLTWKDFWGQQNEPKCTYWEGALEAAAAAVTGHEGPKKEYFEVTETQCIAEGADHCEFEVKRV
jgi:predicted hydrocarbon binding protein